MLALLVRAKPGPALLPVDPGPSQTHDKSLKTGVNPLRRLPEAGEESDYLLIIGKDVAQGILQEAQQDADPQRGAN